MFGKRMAAKSAKERRHLSVKIHEKKEAHGVPTHNHKLADLHEVRVFWHPIIWPRMNRCDARVCA